MIQTLQQKFGKKTIDIILITLGSMIVAIGFNVFLLPNDLVSGGINGLTIILFKLFGLPPSLVLYTINALLLILCYLLLGKEVLMKSILGSFLVPTFISLFHTLSVGYIPPMLAAIFGGVCVGTGIGLVFLGNGSTGGTTLISLLIQKFIPLKLGVLLGICDGLVIFSALFVFPFESVLYSLIALYLTSKLVDTVQVGADFSKSLMIISEKPEDVRKLITTELNYGASLINIEGGFELDAKKMIVTIIQEEQFIPLKQQILLVDPTAFIIVMSANEVVGRGFTLSKKQKSLNH